MKKILSWFQGWSRYFLYYSKEIIKIDLSWLIRKHIREQIEIRINSMNRECYNSGSCVECGCATTALQMANKACEGNCYPNMINKNQWRRGLITSSEDWIWFTNKGKQMWKMKDNKFVKIK